MCSIIETGKQDAVPLKHLHGSDLLQLDEHVDEVIQFNGGYGDLVMELKRGFVTFFRVMLSYPPRIKRVRPAAKPLL